MRHTRRLVQAITLLSPLALSGFAVSAIFLKAHSQQGGSIRRIARTTGGNPVYKSKVKIEIKDGYRSITANGIPDHPTGQFPNNGNPNRLAPQDYHFRVPVNPKPSQGDHRSPLFGVAINGVVFDPGTAELWNGDFRWHYEALTGLLGGRGKLGADDSFAHVQPNGAYHYHGLPMGLLNRLDYKHKMALVGYAADGYPIYGPYVYTNANDPRSPLKLVRSGYRIKNGNRPGGSVGPGGVCDGSFASDYEYVRGSSELDEYNGRTGVTPEFPKGTFYYVLTDNWPFVPRKLRGTPDRSFQKGPGGPGGPGMGGFGGQGGPPPFGGPGGPGGGGRGFGGPGGPPAGMLPADMLVTYLGLNSTQKQKLDRLVKVSNLLRREGLPPHTLGQLKLTDEQIRKIASGSSVRSILTAKQKNVLESSPRPPFGGPGGQGGFGGPGGPPPPGE